MVDGEHTEQFSAREDDRENQFGEVWTQELDDVFSDVAKYYDRANNVATLGLLNWLRDRFVSGVELKSGQKVLDVCAGTNAIGIALLQKQPDLEVSAIDRSKAMQEVGRATAAQQGVKIESIIGDVHQLPFPENHFDVVTLQYASRHLRILDVAREIKRVLRPGGHFYHFDMLRPGNKMVEGLYYSYLWATLRFTSWLYDSNSASLNCQNYFINTLRMFYSADELTQLLGHLGYQDITGKSLLGGTVGVHKAVKGPDL